MATILIEDIENLLWAYLTTAQPIPTELLGATRITQDLGPLLADFLHARGVEVDWSDGSYNPNRRYTPAGFQPPP